MTPMKPRHRPDDDFDDNDDEEKPLEPERDSAGRKRGLFAGDGHRPTPDISRRDDDHHITVRMPDGTERVMARGVGFKFITLDASGRVRRILRPKKEMKT